MKVDRRDFFRRVAAASSAAFLGPSTVWGWTTGRQERGQDEIAFSPAALPLPQDSGIDHIVVVTMENRSFDHFLGWLPNADGKQINSYPMPNSTALASTYALAPDYQGCGHSDPDHSYAGARTEYHAGNMDGWLLDPQNDEYCIGFYEESDLPFLAALARNYTTLDKYFCSFLGPTFPNRIFMLAGQTDRLDNSISLTTLPTIFDELLAAGLSVRYYYSNLPFVGFWGLKYLPISHTYVRFLIDAHWGRLPAVSFLDPRFSILDIDTGNDDHPHSNIHRGEAFLSAVIRALTRGPAWDSTVLIITFDEWGGFFDHVAPPRAIAPNNVDPDLDSFGNALLGFRVPTIIVSPWTRGDPGNPTVNNTVFDHTSILKLIEWRWGLPALTLRDAPADAMIGNLATVLNFAQKTAAVPVLPRPIAPTPSPCSVTAPVLGIANPRRETAWSDLATSGLLEGWNVKVR